MEIGQPDQKRLRLEGFLVSQPQWKGSSERQLPLPLTPQQLMTTYNHPTPSFSRPNPQLAPPDRDQRPSDNTPYVSQDSRRPISASHTYQAFQSMPPFLGTRDATARRDSSGETPYCQSPTAFIADTMKPATHNSPTQTNLTPPNYDISRSQSSYPQGKFPGPIAPLSETPSHPYGASTNIPQPRASEPHPKLSYNGTRINEQVRKKSQRAAQACDCCRTAKAKCDEGRPSCTSCKENRKECRYRDPPLKQQDKASADIMESLSRLENIMQSFDLKMKNLSKEVNDIKNIQIQLRPHILSLNANFKERCEIGQLNSTHYGFTGSVMTTDSNTRSRSRMDQFLTSNDRVDLYQKQNAFSENGNIVSDEEDDIVADPGPPKPPSIPVNHTTGAARLLLVPPIKRMCADIMLHPKFKSEKYPYLQELKRGLLRIYGRGEGTEVTSTYNQELMVSESNEKTPLEGRFNLMLPLKGEKWGQIGGLTSNSPAFENSKGGIISEPLPDFSRKTVLELVDVYVKNINNMHPIITPKSLNQLVESFLGSIHETRSRAKFSQITSVPGSYKYPDSPVTKRKRSSSSSDFLEAPFLQDYKPGVPFRSISTAIVLLCMALGKICQNTKKIPQLPNEQEINYSPALPTGSTSSMQSGWPPSPLHNTILSSSFGISSPSDAADRLKSYSCRQSDDGSQRESENRTKAKYRNVNVIPGLAYFALATDIIGNQMAGSTLQHVHANILAGLFHAQLARIIESAAYISNACRSLQLILRPRLERFRKINAEQKIVQAKDNPLIFAFWTCLQLESDIVAEISFPQTGILTFEEDMPGPNLQAAHSDGGFDQDVIESYSAQLFLRRHLNSLHSMFYKPRDPNTEVKYTAQVLATHKVDEPKFPSIELLSESLEGINVYAPTFRLAIGKLNLPINILGARLRAKYYGARVITYRPFVLQVLERSEPPCPEMSQCVIEQISDKYLSEVQVPVVKHDIREIKDIDPKALEYVRLGLNALINSTTAFYGLGHPGEKRIIVTNVWGTAHAQWGNVLTLQAAYRNPILKPLLLEEITKEELIDLIEKTMGFLALVGSPSSALAIDWKILDLTSRKNGLRSQSTLGLSCFPNNTYGDVLNEKF